MDKMLISLYHTIRDLEIYMQVVTFIECPDFCEIEVKFRVKYQSFEVNI